MQIRHDTAQGMGYQGPASGLLDADTNLTFAVPYLANAYKLSRRRRSPRDQALRRRLLLRGEAPRHARPAPQGSPAAGIELLPAAYRSCGRVKLTPSAEPGLLIRG